MGVTLARGPTLRRIFLPLIILLLATIINAQTVIAETEPTPITQVVKSPGTLPAEILTGVRLVNIEKVDPSSNLYTMDFYLWFIWDANYTTHTTVGSFEFINGAPSYYCVCNETQGFLEYRVKGNFIKNFDCRNYPFDSYDLPVILEHKFLNATSLVYTLDPDSSIDKGLNYVGWNISKFNTSIQNHTVTRELFTDYTFSITVTRPIINSFVKYILPILVITLISLSTFFIKPGMYSQRIIITVTTLISASATHLNILNGLPPTAYLTIADRTMIVVYIIFLANLSVTVLLMRLVDENKYEEASRFNSRAFKVLIVLVVVLFSALFFT